jgi:hypothetical protein
MSAKVRHELCAIVGTYRDAQGNEKKKWQKVGIEMETDQGGRFILLDRWFNPAGIPDPEGRGNVMLSLFDPKTGDGGAQGSRQGSSAGAPGGHPASSTDSAKPAAGEPPRDDFTDDIPF